MDVGAYGASLSSNYNTKPLIAEIIINKTKARVIRKKQDIKSLLLKLQSRGCAVLVTDHNASKLLSVVDRAYVIANGTIVANGTPRQIVNTTEAKKLYFGEDFSF